MERIVLEVDDNVAKVYKAFSPQTKQQFNQTVSLMMKKIINDATSADYFKLLDEISDEALRNGLTPEILDTLLESDD